MNPTLQKTLVFSDLIPDTVNRALMQRLDASGKGVNVSRVLTQLGKNCIHLTQLGGSLRSLFLDLCAQDKINIQWVESNSPIRFCYTLINKKDSDVTELVEEGEQVGTETEGKLLEAYGKLLSSESDLKISTVIISGSMAAGFSGSLISEMVRQAKARSLRVILDIRGKDLLECLPLKPDIIKPNLYEFASTFDSDLVSGNEINTVNFSELEVKKRISNICNELFKEFQCQAVLSRGSNTIWYAENGKFNEFEFESIEPINTTGSGDAFTAGLASVLGDGRSIKEAITEGARCGKLNAMQLRPGVIL